VTRPIVAWSFSALNDFINCPFKYWSVKIGKTVSDINAFNKAGDDYHVAFEQYVARGTRLPAEISRWAPVLDKFKRSPGQVLTERQFCLDEQYQPCGYKEWDRAWVRGAADLLIVNGATALQIDYKFGKVKKDPEQMMLLSALTFHHYPQVNVVKSAYLYANHDQIVPFDFQRDELAQLWNHFLPSVNKLQQAKLKDEWPKTPNPLCAWCPVSTCQYNTNPNFRGPD
jgi:hypothetical protein